MIFKLLLFAIFVVALAAARKSRPCIDRHGSELNDQLGLDNATAADAVLRVATFNVQTGKSLEGKRDITRAASLIADADVVGIQEVYAPSLFNRLGFGQSQTESLATPHGFAWLFCATRRRWLREHRGNALLSKLKVDNWQIEGLPDKSGKSYRNMTIALAHWQGQAVHIINTHLHTRQGREEQLRIVLREFAKYPRAILLGDFNSRTDDAILRDALKNIEIIDAIAIGGVDQTEDRIDWILTKGFTVHSGEKIDKGVSDHPYYSVTLSIKDGSI